MINLATTRAAKVSIKKQNRRTATVTTEHGSYNTKHFAYGKNRIRSSAISELQNPDVVYILGGTPTYIHSTEAYFRAGVKTAEAEMNQMLNELVNEQQTKMQERIIYINQRWAEALRTLGYTEPAEQAFNKFRKMWLQLLHSDNAKEYLTALAALSDTKQASVLMVDFDKSIEEAKRKLNSAINSNPEKFSTQDDKNTFLQNEMSTKGFNIKVEWNDALSHYEYGGDIKEIRKAAQKNAMIAIKHGLQHNAGAQLNRLQNIVRSHIPTQLRDDPSLWTNADAIVGYLKPTEIGDIFEVLDSSIIPVGDEALINSMGANIAGMFLELVAPEHLDGPTTGEGNETKKIDTLIHLINESCSGEVVFSVPVSDKTGAIIDYASKNADGATVNFIDRFTASINSADLDFSRLQTGAKSTSLEKHQDKLLPLFNYVLRNDAAFSGQQNFIQPFKEMIACYIGWLKIVTEIVGNTQAPEEWAMAIRTPHNLYNTATIMETFTHLSNPLDIVRGEHYINVTELKEHFYKSRLVEGSGKSMEFVTNTVMTAGQRSQLYAIKRNVIDNLVATKQPVTYKNIYNKITADAQLTSVLQGLKANSLRLPPIRTWYQINLGNFMRTLQIE